MRRFRAPSSGLDKFFAAQFSAGYITNMSGFDLRQAQEAMEKRLQAMIDAANTVKPALNDFYGSLSSEQKARCNRLGSELAQSGM